jgi:hypothetical protein
VDLEEGDVYLFCVCNLFYEGRVFSILLVLFTTNMGNERDRGRE